MTETLYVQWEGSVLPNLRNKPDFIQEVDSFSYEGIKTMRKTRP